MQVIYYDYMDKIIKVCKKHGELTENQIYFRKKRTPECKECVKIRQEKYYEWKFPNREPKKTLPEGMVKDCKYHGLLTKEETYSKKDHRNSHWIIISCKYCKKEYAEKNKEKISERLREKGKVDRKLNPEKYKLRQRKYLKKFRDIISKKRIIRKYKISIQEYDKMFLEQDNKCYICKKEETKINTRGDKNRTSRLSLDHCHLSGKVRKLLCHNCNIMIGASKESIETLENAIKYLGEFK